MTRPAAFKTIFLNEVLYNSKRVAPYAMMVLFSANAVLWWGAGPAVIRGWATNSDFYIVRMCIIFSFMTVPLFTALLMGDPVIRDFNLRIDPLVFSNPVGRAEYVLGKFFGNFFVLVCCQACFALTLCVLQASSVEGMLILSPRVFPYLKHFFALTVLSNLLLAVLYFTVGTLTRNVKLVYGAAVSFYLLYITWQVAILKGMPQRWRVLLDPLLMNWGDGFAKRLDAEQLNRLSIVYDGEMLSNRALVLLASAACLTLLCRRFSNVEGFKGDEDRGRVLTLELRDSTERLSARAEDFGPGLLREAVEATSVDVSVPEVRTSYEGFGAGLRQFAAATGAEFRLLRSERGLVVVLPLVALLCGLQLSYIGDAHGAASYSGIYASETINPLLIFLFGITVFYTGEALNRDRELRVEPVLWCAPAPDFVFLLSKFAAVFLLSLSLVLLVAVTSVALQIYRGHTPVEPRAYLSIYSVVLLPGVLFMTSAAIALNVVLRDKYLAYASSIAAGIGGFFLSTNGYNGWLYNPLLQQLWTPSDFERGGSLSRIFVQRIYFLAIATFCLALAHLCFERKPRRGVHAGGRLRNAGRTLVSMMAALLTAVVTGLTLARWR